MLFVANNLREPTAIELIFYVKVTRNLSKTFVIIWPRRDWQQPNASIGQMKSFDLLTALDASLVVKRHVKTLRILSN